MGSSPLVDLPVDQAAGPLRHATLLVSDVHAMQGAYAALGLVVCERSTISAARAKAWGHASLAGRSLLGLGTAADGPSLLRLIKRPGAAIRPTRYSHGWLALEILVRDVDALAQQLTGSSFEIVGAPADLDVSPHIRAMQVIGPAGEMLYLTQVKAPVPPFEVPLSSQLQAPAQIGPLFIAVLSTPSRAASLQACAALAPKAQLQFDTKVTVLNRALGRPVDARWPVATVQWAGESLFEIDEVVDDRVRPAAAPGELPSGLAWIAMDAPNNSAAPAKLQELSPGAWIELLPSPRSARS